MKLETLHPSEERDHLDKHERSSLIIGPSCGWLSAKLGPDLKAHGEVLTGAGANAFEFVVGGSERMQAIEKGDFAHLHLPLDYRSIHLGDFTSFSASLIPEQKEALHQIRRVCERHNLLGSSLHPDITPQDALKHLEDFGIPVGIENMDRMKDFGKTTEDLALLLSRSRPGVIDLQHLAENAQDSGIPIAMLSRKFAELMIEVGGGITHLHVSGERSKDGKQYDLHSNLSIATNREAVLEALLCVFQVAGRPLPIILEGDPLPKFECLEARQRLDARETQERIRIAQETIAMDIQIIERFLRKNPF